MTPIVLLTFWGRRANIELQLPFVERILAENPNVEFHVWNLAKTPEDDQYIRDLLPLDRMTVRHDYFSSCPWTGFNHVYRWYANEPTYSDTMFVKLDDDIVFIETDRWAHFVDLARQYPGYVVSAKVINNGASTSYECGLWREFLKLGIELLDVHESNAYAEAMHTYMFDHWRELICGQMGWPTLPHSDFPTGADWMSINCIAFNHHVMRTIADTVGKPSPRFIAGRDCRQWPDIGDEGVCNTLPRIIVQGFLAAHLSYGPQKMTDEQANLWRKRYGEIAREYLSDNTAQVTTWTASHDCSHRHTF